MITGYVRRGQRRLQRWILDPRVLGLARGSAHALAGFCLSAASLERGMLPLVLGLVWACRGWRAVLVAVGGGLGYGLFWGAGSLQGLVWTGLALAGVLLLGQRRITREAPLLIPAVGMLMVSATGLAFQIFADDTTSVPLYLIRVALGGATPWLFSKWIERKEPLLEWICLGLFSLGLAQIAPVPWLGLGFVAAGFAAVRGAFPCAALTGLALDLAGITPIPMTGVTVLAWLVRFFPRYPKWVGSMAPGIVALFLMQVWGKWDLLVLPGLFLGAIAASLFPSHPKSVPRRGETGTAQVRLEMAAGVLRETAGLLAEVPVRIIDTEALARRAAEEACTGCAARDRCRDIRRISQLPGSLLGGPLLTAEELPVRCKKGSRVLAELRRAQEQYRTLEADRRRQQEYREAVVRQYDFLGAYLRKLSDDLASHGRCEPQAYEPVVSVWGNRKGQANGDRCMAFPGTGNQYYIVLCDGMGTGIGAVQEGRTAGSLLRRLLGCGFPPEHALESLNSLCALRERAGAVTVDLVQLELDFGKATLYKWGAAASWLVGGSGVEKLGGVTPPPGLVATESRQMCCSFSMKREQLLLLVSDGLEAEKVQSICKAGKHSPATLAEELLRSASLEDDATVVTIQLLPVRQ